MCQGNMIWLRWQALTRQNVVHIPHSCVSIQVLANEGESV